MIKQKDWAQNHRTLRVIAAATALFLCALIPSRADAQESTPQVQRRGNMFVVLTDYYYIETDVSAQFAIEIAEHLHAVGAVYYQMLSGFGGGRMDRFRVSVYRDRRDYDEVVGPDAANTRGLYDPRTRHLLATAGPDTDEILHILRHEAFHQFVHHFLGLNVPPWVNEGLAEYFCYSRIQDGSLTAGELPPRILRFVQAAIRANQTIPFTELVSLSLPEWNRLRETNPDRGSLAYAQSHLLAHFLMEAEGGRYRRRLHTYLVNISRGVTGRAAFESAFGRDMAGMERAWARYVLSLEPSPRYLCRENMDIIGKLLVERGRGERYTAAQFRDALMNGRLGEWELGDQNGRVIRHDQPNMIETLFVCVFNRDGGDGGSYEFRYESDEAPLPTIICRHPGNYIIRLNSLYDQRERQWWYYFSEEHPSPD